MWLGPAPYHPFNSRYHPVGQRGSRTVPCEAGSAPSNEAWNFSALRKRRRQLDALNLFPNVGALIFVGGPNDFGIPPGIVAQCTGTLIEERVFLTAGHCVATARPRLSRLSRRS